jgi:hypothetical protein
MSTDVLLDADVLPFLRKLLSECGRILKLVSGLQNPLRKELVEKLQGVCSRCDDSYAFVLARLGPVRKTGGPPARLARALRDFAGDKEIRARFKPEHLCGGAEHILDQLENNLHPLKYAIPLGKVRSLRKTMAEFRRYDDVIHDSVDDFLRSLNALADELDYPRAGDDPDERMHYVRTMIEEFEEDLSRTVRDIRDVKNSYLRP